MLPDTVDFAELQTGARFEGFFYSLFVFFGKMAAGVGLAMSNLALDAAGYTVVPGEQQPAAVELTLRTLVGLVPAGLALGSVFLLFLYPITEEMRQETRATLARRASQRRGSLQSNGSGGPGALKDALLAAGQTAPGQSPVRADKVKPMVDGSSISMVLPPSDFETVVTLTAEVVVCSLPPSAI
jgi:hypothetical protein